MRDLRTIRQVSTYSKGFTIVETLIAMAVFSVIMLVLVVGVMRMTTSYVRGVNTNNTQALTRNISEILTQELKFNTRLTTDGMSTEGGAPQFFCIGASKYIYAEGKKYSDSIVRGVANVGLVVAPNPGTSCTTPTDSEIATGRQLLGNNTRIVQLNVTSPGAEGSARKLELGVALGDADLLCAYNEDSSQCTTFTGDIASGGEVRCRSVQGSEFCAVSYLKSYVQRIL